MAYQYPSRDKYEAHKQKVLDNYYAKKNGTFVYKPGNKRGRPALNKVVNKAEMPINCSEFFLKGKFDNQHGVSCTNNPYRKGTPRFYDWREGWLFSEQNDMRLFKSVSLMEDEWGIEAE